LSFSTMMKIARIIKREFVKHVKICDFSINMMRDEEIKLFKKMILWRSFKLYKLYSKSKCTRFINEKIRKLNSAIFAFLTILNQTIMFREKRTSSKKTILQEFHRLICWIFHFKILWIDKKSAIKIWANSKNTNKKRIVKSRKKTSSWNDFQSKSCVFLRFHWERLNSFWDLVVYKNSHDIAQNLTSFWISSFQNVDKNDRRNSKKSNQKRSVKILLWILSKFLIFRSKKKEKYRLINVVLKMNKIIIQNAN
jgi:hypothetical protein